MADSRSKALERGRAQEKAGQLAEALESYRRAGAGAEVARLLAAAAVPGHLNDAALLLGEAPPPFEELEPLDDELAADDLPPLLPEEPAKDALQELEPEPSLPPPAAPLLVEEDVDLSSFPPPPRAPPSLIPPSARASFVPGALVADRYRLEEQIGQGGMARVFRATDLELEEQVALKVFTFAEATDLAVQRFKRELKLSRQLTHPNIIRLHDIGLHEGHRYLSMELLQGESLKSRLLKPLGFVEALRILEQACAGLQAAHDMGVIHRDVKPDNFFLTREGVVKVMDFGIAKQQAAPGVTVVGSIAGTPAYMSPEQVSNFSSVGPATDLYALGIMAYEIFTGAVPFIHEDLVPLLLLHVNQKPVSPREKNPGVPEELERVILRLLEKSPANRYASARALLEELRAIRQSYESVP